MKEIPNIPRPTTNVIQRHLSRWHKLENYRLQEDCLNRLFGDLCPENKTIEDILLKVSTLNDFYSTNIFNTYSVAKHILRCDIDKRLSEGDPTLVNEIAKVRVKGKKGSKGRVINFYSFATKYCTHHQPESFTIYDYYVERVLVHFRRVHEFAAFKKDDLKDYRRFLELIREFRSFYGLGEFTMREIDIFLWLTGKKYFPKKY